MANYKKMYFTLFNRITDALMQIENRDYKQAETTLKGAQQETEALYISDENQEK